MATSPEEQYSEEQPEEEEEEEGNKKTVTEEKRPHESAKKNDDSDSQRDEKKLKESVDGAKDDKNPRNVQLEADQLKPFLVRLEHDPETQLSFWTGMRDYHRNEETLNLHVIWINVNLDVLYLILHTMADYQSTLYKFPHDNVDDMEVFVKQWLRMDVDAENCREVILWLQKYYNKRYCKPIGLSAIFLGWDATEII
ncbi:hypothetical protein ACOSP7_030572 [Xanthoceras sorbifolium]